MKEIKYILFTLAMFGCSEKQHVIYQGKEYDCIIDIGDFGSTSLNCGDSVFHHVHDFTVVASAPK